MRVMAIIMATNGSMPGVARNDDLAGAIGRFNEQLVRAGVMLASEQLKPADEAVRLRPADGGETTIDRSARGDGATVRGFWLWQVRSIDEAIEWARRSPWPVEGTMEIELRQVLELNG